MKKFLALAVSALMLVAMMPSALAANEAAMVMYEPDVFVNNNDKTAGNTITWGNPVTGTWMTYSDAAIGSVYATEDSGNTFIKMTDKRFGTNDSFRSGGYGAVLPLADSAVTGKNISFEIKIKLPVKNKKIEFKFKEESTSPPNTSYNYGTYIVAQLTATDNGYVYNDYHSNGGADNTFVLAPYSNQWISLKWIFNTVDDSYDLYCNGSFVAKISNAKFHTSGADSSGATVTPGLKFVQICLPENGEAWLDDAAFDANVANENPLYVNAPVIKSLEDEVVKAGLVNVPLLKADGSAYGKETGLIISAVDTSMVGTYTVPVENISDASAKWNVYRTSNFLGNDFDGSAYGYETSGTTTQTNAVVESIDGNALKLGAPISNSNPNRNYEYVKCELPDDEKNFEYLFDIYWTAPGTTQTFYTSLHNTTNLPVMQLVWTMYANGKFEVKSNNKLLFSGNISNGVMQRVRFVIDRENRTFKSYLNGVLSSVYSFDVFTYNPESGLKLLCFYTYTTGNETETDFAKYRDVYIDNLYVKTYETVASVDTSAAEAEVKVVKNQLPALVQTVPSTLTDGTTDILPIKWDAVDTATTGTKTATGTVLGFADTTVNATVNVIELPYEMNVAEGTITITAPTNYTPAGKLYIASYEGGVLKNVSIHSAPVEGSTTVSASGNVKVFLLTDALVPLAEAK